MPTAVLITQCLQRDFVGKLDKDEALPCKLHIGHREAERLLGPDPARGPVTQLMRWARAQSAERLRVIHVRDWHDAADPLQHDHLARFGPHCLKDTKGAELCLGVEDDPAAAGREVRVDSIALNDFENTGLAGILEDALAAAPDGKLRVAVVGVWTDAKVSFLFYDLLTRMRVEELATSSALTASSSRTHHFLALEQLRRLLGVRVYDTVGELCEWLLPEGARPPLAGGPGPEAYGPRLDPEADGVAPLDAVDRDLLSYLYRGSASVRLSELGGGFSGARVFQVESRDAVHAHAPSVAKVGPRTLIGRERTAFEQVEAILGNHAPRVSGFGDLGERAAIRYAYASMGDGGVRTFKGIYEADASDEEVAGVLKSVFEDVLGRFYRAAVLERLPLLEHYGFTPDLADRVRRNVAEVVGEEAAAGERLAFPGGHSWPNVTRFYERFLAEHAPSAAASGEQRYVAYVHGDLNGANILLDARDNPWVIDFCHTARGHVLKDVAKLENDLLYIFTPLASEAELAQALAITRALAEVRDLKAGLPEAPPPGVEARALTRAWRTLRALRGHTGRLVQDDHDPVQLSVALLRYAAHTMTFDESSPLQKRWALAAACAHAEVVERGGRFARLKGSRPG